MTIREWLPRAAESLRQAGVGSPGLEAQVLAAHARGVDRSTVIAHPEWEVDKEADHLLARRLTGEPLAYLTGFREFYGRRFRVTKDVLIPRQETETLVDACLRSEATKSASTLLDLGTGSGCIGITMKMEKPHLQVTLADISVAALEIAAANAERLGATVEFVESDGFRNLAGRKFDLILSNPPYVAQTDQLPKEVKEFEPNEALFAGPEGLDFYERLAEEACAYLVPEGRIFLELGDGQDERVAAIFVKKKWTVKAFHRDLSGHNRVLELVCE